jgi:sorbitol-specific phosphotransferase system component IIC
LVEVLTRTTKAGVVALPIHDSLIVSIGNEGLLRMAMTQGYEDLTVIQHLPSVGWALVEEPMSSGEDITITRH